MGEHPSTAFKAKLRPLPQHHSLFGSPTLRCWCQHGPHVAPGLDWCTSFSDKPLRLSLQLSSIQRITTCTLTQLDIFRSSCVYGSRRVSGIISANIACLSFSLFFPSGAPVGCNLTSASYFPWFLFFVLSVPFSVLFCSSNIAGQFL